MMGQIGRQVAMRVSERAPVRWKASRRVLPVRELLEWAFGVEHARLELDEGAGPGMCSTEYRLMMRAMLLDPATGKPVKIDGGGRSSPASDADLVADTVARIPLALGGRTMALVVAEHARAGRVPDAMVGAEPRMVPRDWVKNRWGWRAKTERCGVELVEERGVPTESRI